MDKPIQTTNDPVSEKFYHGTKANLQQGNLIEPGFSSNYGQRKMAKYVYLTATLDAAIWGAELAVKKFPGNPTKSYRTKDPLRVIGEVVDWQGHTPEQLKAMKDGLERLKELGIEAIED